MTPRHWMNDYSETRRLTYQPQRHENYKTRMIWRIGLFEHVLNFSHQWEKTHFGYLKRDSRGYARQETTLMFFPSVHAQVSNKGTWISVAEVRRVSRTWSSAVFVHGGSRQKVQISAGVCWGRESLPHHRQHCQPCVKRNLAGRQPNSPTRGHSICYGSRSAAFCKPEFGSMATRCLEVVVCKIAQCCRYNSFCRCWGLRKYFHYSCQRSMKSGFQIGTCMNYFFGLPFLN